MPFSGIKKPAAAGFFIRTSRQAGRL